MVFCDYGKLVTPSSFQKENLNADKKNFFSSMQSTRGEW